MVFIGFIIFILFLISAPKIALLFCISVLVGLFHPALGVAFFFAILATAGFFINSRKT